MVRKWAAELRAYLSCLGDPASAGFREDAPENNLEVSVAAARIMRHCFNDPGYRGPLPTRYRG